MSLIKRWENPIRGGFIVRPTDDFRNDFFIPFLFNPRPIETQDKANYSEHKLPGRSDPLLQYLNGDAQVITMQIIVEQLRIDEVRSRIKKVRGGTIVGSDLDPTINNAPEDDDFTTGAFNSPDFAGSLSGGSFLPATAREYTELIKSLLYPREAVDTFVRKSPPKLVFVWGKTVIKCVVTRVRVSEEEHFQELDLEHSLIDITIKRDDPLFPRIFRGKVSSANQSFLPKGISVDDVRNQGALRPRLPSGYQFL